MKLTKIFPLIIRDWNYKREDKFIPELSYTNLDDVFSSLNSFGVEEIEVKKEEMGMIVKLFLINCGDKEPKKGQILRENILDKFMGVKLILED